MDGRPTEAAEEAGAGLVGQGSSGKVGAYIRKNEPRISRMTRMGKRKLWAGNERLAGGNIY